MQSVNAPIALNKNKGLEKRLPERLRFTAVRERDEDDDDMANLGHDCESAYDTIRVALLPSTRALGMMHMYLRQVLGCYRTDICPWESAQAMSAIVQARAERVISYQSGNMSRWL